MKEDTGNGQKSDKPVSSRSKHIVKHPLPEDGSQVPSPTHPSHAQPFPPSYGPDPTPSPQLPRSVTPCLFRYPWKQQFIMGRCELAADDGILWMLALDSCFRLFSKR